MGSSKTKRCNLLSFNGRDTDHNMKINKLRFNEYYDFQKELDRLYSVSKNGDNFYKLVEIIGSEQNIKLAYRNLKTNKGSKTPGTDGLTIKDISDLPSTTVIEEVRKRIKNYKPKPVRRVLIPKVGSDKMRPLGIPTIWDRLVQQCILQILEPICEAKFHKHSYGFRPNRSTHHAVSRMVSLINIGKYYYCVDVDIKGFFDNVNHSKLLKQMWNLGIRDKSLLSIISKLLKAEIEGEGIPTKGTPQGGIISPLLSNIVLNELDWWVSSQWETYKSHRYKDGGAFRQYAKKHTNLKGGYIVRYADDFKVMCRTYEEAQKFYHAIKDFVGKRLKLEINEDKSVVANLKNNSTDFLGFRVRLIKKGKTRYGYVAQTHISKKAISKIKNNLRSKIKSIQRSQNKDNALKYNLMVIGIHNYYKVATNVYNNLDDVNYIISKSIKTRLKNNATVVRLKDIDENSKKFMTSITSERKITKIFDIPLIPICAVKHKSPMNFSQNICNFTVEGRKVIHENLRCIPKDVLNQVMNTKLYDRSIEYLDNRISKYVSQYGKCYVTGKIIELDSVYCHHIIPIKHGGNDKYSNLVIVERKIAKLINCTNVSKVLKEIDVLELDNKQVSRLNKLRAQVGNIAI